MKLTHDQTDVIARSNEPVPVYGPSDFAPSQHGWSSIVNDFGMRGVSDVAVVLSRLFGSRAGEKIGIITYHRVSSHFRGLPPPTHNVTPERFRAHLTYLLTRGFKVWPLRELLRCRAEGRNVPARTIAITFDDGFQSVFSHAFPIMQELKVPATIFVNTAYLDSDAPFPFDYWGLEHREQLPVEAYRPLSVEQCQEMVGTGLIDFGAHTHTHRDLRSDPQQFADDVEKSVDIVRSIFRQDEVMFAFPYGSKWQGFAGPELVAAARQTNVICGLTTDCALVDLKSDPFDWGRFNAFHWDTGATLTAKLEGWFTWAAQLKRSIFRLRRAPGEITAKSLSH